MWAGVKIYSTVDFDILISRRQTASGRAEPSDNMPIEYIHHGSCVYSTWSALTYILVSALRPTKAWTTLNTRRPPSPVRWPAARAPRACPAAAPLARAPRTLAPHSPQSFFCPFHGAGASRTAHFHHYRRYPNYLHHYWLNNNYLYLWQFV